jgi:TonB-dependent receptor
MLATEWSRTVSTLVGVRVENTSVSYVQKVSRFEGDGSYTDVLPSLHLTVRPDRNTNLRFGISSGLARPHYAALVPYERIDDEELTITRGNPDLAATRSRSFDAAVERYNDRLGLLSAAFFYKDITDVIATGVSQETIAGETYEATRPINGETASLWGIELSLNQRLSAFGVPWLRDFGVFGNYTYTDSKTDVGGRELDLPNAARHTWNAALFYDNPVFGFATTLAANQRSAILIAVGGTPAEDHYFESEFHLDLSMTQRLRSGATLFFKVNNLTDQREQEVFGEPYADRVRLHQFEDYGRTATVGLRVDFGRAR